MPSRRHSYGVSETPYSEYNQWGHNSLTRLVCEVDGDVELISHLSDSGGYVSNITC